MNINNRPLYFDAEFCDIPAKKVISMKRLSIIIIIAIAAIVAAGVTVKAFMRPIDNNSTVPDEQGHIFIHQWKTYYDAVSADRPKKQMEALDAIKKIARDRRVAWDFWDASVKYFDVSVSRDWKSRDSLISRMEREVKEFDEPVLTILYRRSYLSTYDYELLKYITENAARLEKAKNEPFYKHEGHIYSYMSGQLPEYISNDFEYLLWINLPSYGNSEGLASDRTYKMLDSIIKGRYPDGAYLHYLNVAANTDDGKREAALKDFVKEYKGKAISYFAESDLLAIKKDSLDNNNAGSDEYEKLYKECKAFESRRHSLSGKEKVLAEDIVEVEDLIKTLTAPSISVKTFDDKALVLVRNLDEVTLNIAPSGSKKTVFKKNFKNSRRSFYAIDTIKIELPKLDDGIYGVTAYKGKHADYDSYSKYSISLAERRDSKGYGIYAADYITGEPLKSVDVHLVKNGRTVASTTCFALKDGFTMLPEVISGAIKGRSWYDIEVSYKGDDGYLRKSRRVSVSNDRDRWMKPSSRDYGKIFLDRKAFNPGDTVHFKSVFYRGDMVSSVRAFGAGTGVTATLYDSENNKLKDLSLSTNEFGAVAGEFVLPEGLRNGRFSIKIKSGSVETDDYFRVDEFVLPTFDLAFDEIKRLYLPGDTVKISGVVRSYSSHSLSSAKALFTSVYAGDVLSEGSLKIAADGRFEILVPSSSDDWQYINTNVKIIDATGETHEYNKDVYVGKRLMLSMDLQNKADAEISLDVPMTTPKKQEKIWQKKNSAELVTDATAQVKISVKNAQGVEMPLDIEYVLYDEKDKEIEKGSVASGEIKKFDLSSLPDGLYVVKTKAYAKSDDGKITSEVEESLNFVCLTGNLEVLDAPVEHVFWRESGHVGTGDEIKALVGTANGKKLWAVVEVFGDNMELIDSRLVTLSGERGKAGSLTTVAFPYKAEYPDAVMIQILYFRDSMSRVWSTRFRRRRNNLDLPLEFSVFENRALPDKEYIFKMKTIPGVECVASIYDKSLDNISMNSWNGVSLNQFDIPPVSIIAVPGVNGERNDYWLSSNMSGELSGLGYMAKKPSLMMRGLAKAKSDNVEAPIFYASPMSFDAEIAAESVLQEVTEVQEIAISKIGIRDNFANTLTFQPFVRSNENGDMELKFRTSDKLSTYYVRLFAHDKEMKNAVLSKEMVVSVPVKVAVVEPKYLYAGDKYRLSASVSSNSDKPVSGTLALYQYDGEDYKTLKPVKSSSMNITIPVGKSVSGEFDVAVPSDADRESGKPIGLKVVFVADDSSFSDGVFVSVPIYRNVQVLTEAHSAVLLAGMDKEALIEKIRSSFVNVSSYGAGYKEISVIDMVREAIPSKVNPVNTDCLSLSEAYYVRLVAEALGVSICSDSSDFVPNEKLLAGILACRNADGGFSWFEGMSSSPVITSVILERFAKLRDAGLLDVSDLGLDKSVGFLDAREFDFLWPFWCGGLSTDQYLYIRSLYPSVKFSVQSSERPIEFAKRMADFKKYVKGYLVPKEDRGLNGYILGKARRLMTLMNLVASIDGVALAKAWGISLSADGKMKRSLQADVVSLLEYAVEHSDGGIYYPNAVMPLRGLLESEAYAHSMLCDLLTAYSSKDYAVASSSDEASRIADGIRIWLMLQKEAQKWDDDEPAFVDAVNSVLSGSEQVKATKVILIKKTFEKPFEEIKATGNKIRVEKNFYLISSVEHDALSMQDKDGNAVEGVRISEGTVLHRGDKVKAEYKIWSQENLSFVRLSAPREASLRPVHQLSGMYGWAVHPFCLSSWYFFVPHSYRNVKVEKSEYYFDTFPEESTTISEEFFVTQSGAFMAPVVEIECLYSPHYRANGKFEGRMIVE